MTIIKEKSKKEVVPYNVYVVGINVDGTWSIRPFLSGTFWATTAMRAGVAFRKEETAKKYKEVVQNISKVLIEKEEAEIKKAKKRKVKVKKKKVKNHVKKSRKRVSSGKRR